MITESLTQIKSSKLINNPLQYFNKGINFFDKGIQVIEGKLSPYTLKLNNSGMGKVVNIVLSVASIIAVLFGLVFMGIAIFEVITDPGSSKFVSYRDDFSLKLLFIAFILFLKSPQIKNYKLPTFIPKMIFIVIMIAICIHSWSYAFNSLWFDLIIQNFGGIPYFFVDLYDGFLNLFTRYDLHYYLLSYYLVSFRSRNEHITSNNEK